MTFSTTHRRLRKLEGDTLGLDADGFPLIPGPWFFVCGRSEGEIRATHAAVPDAPSSFVPVLWTSADPVPAPYSSMEMSDEVLDSLLAWLRSIGADEPDQAGQEQTRRTAERLTDVQLTTALVSPFVIHTRPQ